jgi:type 2 lantibiotic biosynthesis protein LanM
VANENTWLNAQTLQERRDALRKFKGKLEVDHDLAQERMETWKNIRALKDDAVFKRRLAIDDLSEEEFFKILGTSPEQLFGPDYVPEWLAEVLKGESEGREPLFKSASFWSYADRGILAPFMPMICRYSNKLYRYLSEQTDLMKQISISLDEVLDLILAPALQRIEYYHRSAVILEVNVQRMLSQLEGETPEERFANFKVKMRNPEERAKVQKKYPVLTRSLQRTLDFWLANNIEFFGRLGKDLPQIRKTFGIADDDALAKIDPGSGDVHCQGRSVATVTFKSGAKILYKPRNLAIDQHFRKLIQWCEDKHMDPPVRSINLINFGADGHGYGWVEFIKNRPCDTAAEHDEFYRRLGGLIAMLHALSTVDIHFENLVACGPDPYVIDLETLFHVNLDELEVRSASDSLAIKLRDSVMSIGILPTPMLSGEGKKTFDTSAIGASVNQQAPYKVLGLVNLGRDDVNISHIPGWIPSVHNRPSEDASRPIPSEKIIAGFESVYRFIVAHREELLADEGPIAAFRHLRGRLIARNTRFYGTLFLEAIHPDFLRDELDMVAHWDEIWNDIIFRPMVEKFIPSEYPQIRDGDIFFTTNLKNSDHVMGADGQEIKGASFKSGFERAQHTILEMSEENMVKQVWLIRASLGATENYLMQPIQNEKTASQLEIASDIGFEVLKQLERFKNMASSLHVVSITGEHDTTGAYSIVTSGADLYEGNSGIALFLAYLGQEAENPVFTDAARGLINDVLHVLHSRNRPWNNLSGFIGAPSLVYVLTHLGSIWKDQSLIDEAQKLVKTVLKVTPDEKSLDVLLGPAGCLLAVLPLAQSHRGDALKLAKQCASYLTTLTDDGEKRWKKIEIKRGFSHGLSGVAFAFQELARLTKDQGYALEAREMLAIEREFLKDGRWTDIHNYKGRPQVSWCHGATGIALGRLGMYQSLKDSSDRNQIQSDIHEALEEVSKHFYMESQCLCHGSLGNLEPLLVAKKFNEFEKWTKDLNDRVETVKSDVVSRGWRSMLPNQTLSIDLFTGLSGLGFGFLRLHNPQAVPSVMLLAAPEKPLKPTLTYRFFSR